MKTFLTVKTKVRKYALSYFLIPLKFRKAGRVWCGGARETQLATCQNRVTPSKTKEFLNLLEAKFFEILAED